MISDYDFQRAAIDLDLQPAHIKAFAEVESTGDGFLSPGKPKILFERHIFYKQLTQNMGELFTAQAAKAYPDLCSPKPYGPGGYGKYSEQYAKLEKASEIDKNSAMEACSWGAFQIMGYHWKKMGLGSVQEFVNSVSYSETAQLSLLVRFLKINPGIILALMERDWAQVAKLYNGPNYKQNNYDTKLRDAYKKFGGK